MQLPRLQVAMEPESYMNRSVAMDRRAGLVFSPFHRIANSLPFSMEMEAT